MQRLRWIKLPFPTPPPNQSPGWADACSFVQLVSSRVAQTLGVYPAKGSLMPGADADFVLWCAHKMAPTEVYLKGKLVISAGELVDGAEPRGEILCPPPFPTPVYGPVLASEKVRL